MLLEGEVDWTLVFAILAAIGFVMAALAGIAAVRHGRGRHHVASHLDKARQSAASTDRRLFEILNAVPVALVQTDVQGKFVFANRAAHQLLGRRDVELLGLRFHSATWGIVFPDGRPIPPDMLPTARALRGQTVKGFQHLLANPSTRRQMLVSVTAMPILDELGQVIGSTAAVVETEGLTTPEPPSGEAPPPPPQVEQPMVRRLFDAAPECLVVVSPHGLVREANQAAQVLAAAGGPGGLDQGVLDADFADRFVAEPDRVAARQTLRAALTASQPGELVAPAVDGRMFDWTLTPLLDARGRAEFLVLSGQAAPVEPEAPASDEAEVETGAETGEEAEVEAAPAALEPAPSMTAPEREAQIAAAEALEARRQETGRLAAGLTQEFGALLSVMTGAVQMMADQADQPDKVRRLAEAAMGAGRRGEGLARRMAALTGGDAAAPEQALDMAALLRGLEGRLKGASPDIDLMIETPAEPVVVRLDPTGFEAAMSALVLNAAQAGAGAVSLRLGVEGDQAVLGVRDDGSGMDAGTLRRAPEAFFTTRPGAAGLGLSQVAAFAEQAGGGLELRSVEGQGAEALVIVPLGTGA